MSKVAKKKFIFYFFREFESLTKDVNEFMETNMKIEDVAMGFIKVANETM